MELFKKNKVKMHEQGEQIMHIPLCEVYPNPNQPRKLFKIDELQSLAQSIEEVGLLQPISVRRATDHWELIAGERRLRACQLVGLTHIPCVVLEVDSGLSSVLALVENVQRSNLDYIEEAHAISQIITTYGLSQEEVSRQLGKSQSAVANILRLLRLTDPVVDKLREGRCTQRHARALLKLPDSETQLAVLDKVVEKGWNVSQTEAYIETLLLPVGIPAQGGMTKIIIKDIRIFLNSVNHSMEIMRSAGYPVDCHQEDSENEILLTIRVPRKVASPV